MSSGDGVDAGKRQSPVDWRDLARRLEAARTTQQGPVKQDMQERGRILKARARALGRSAARPSDETERLEVLEFILSDERYGLESRYVREVHPLEHLTPLPCTPAFVLGIVNLRGEILSVIDLRSFFDLPERGLTPLSRVIVLEGEGMVFGVLADAITGTRRVAPAELQPTLPTLDGVRQAYLKGVGTDGLVLLDAAKLLTDERIVVDEQISA